MADKLEELIREIAAKHGIAVARDDPILVLQTINNRLLQDSAAAHQEQLDRFKEEMEGVSLRWQNDAKEKAERIVNAALAASAQAMNDSMTKGALTAADAVRDGAADAFRTCAPMISSFRHLAAINIAAALVVMISCAVLVTST
ncbi:transcriptional activator TraM [Pseudoduganella lurida]|uniref:Transcriptional activator TraM n=1 Tax=Pseudoduganella lurida TaxID=1036180 RepID=A0A562R0E3_9BURK|nr:conjugal transfer protein TraM [Pseudoduganella lurida]TWI62539.1 transcriptional activator TraM [Pseudoduganella lurida]